MCWENQFSVQSCGKEREREGESGEGGNERMRARGKARMGIEGREGREWRAGMRE